MTKQDLRSLTDSELAAVSGGGESDGTVRLALDVTTGGDSSIEFRDEEATSSPGGQGGNLAQNSSPGGPQSSVR